MFEVPAEAHDLLGDVRSPDEPRDFLRDRSFVGEGVGAQLFDPLGQPCLQTGQPVFGRRGDPIEQLPQPNAPAVEIRPQVRPFPAAHRVEIVERRRNHLLGPLDDRRVLRRRLVAAFADGERLRKPEQIGGTDRAGRVAAIARAIERRLQALEERLVQLDLDRRRLALLDRHVDLDPPARDAALDHAADLRLGRRQRLWHAQLDVEKPVIDRLDGRRDSRQLVVAGQRREARHALDHGWLAAASSGCRSKTCCAYSLA